MALHLKTDLKMSPSESRNHTLWMQIYFKDLENEIWNKIETLISRETYKDHNDRWAEVSDYEVAVSVEWERSFSLSCRQDHFRWLLSPSPTTRSLSYPPLQGLNKAGLLIMNE